MHGAPAYGGHHTARAGFQRKGLDELLQRSHATKQRRTIVQIKDMCKIVPPALATGRPQTHVLALVEGVLCNNRSPTNAVHCRSLNKGLSRRTGAAAMAWENYERSASIFPTPSQKQGPQLPGS